MKETNGKKENGLSAALGVVTIFMIGVVYSFLGGFAMSLIIGLTDLAPETLELVRYIVHQVVNAAWFITIFIMLVKAEIAAEDDD